MIQQERSTTYVIDVESAAEMARLTLQARLITEAMNDAFPEKPSSGPQTILDLACGPGEWVLEQASRSPQTQVVGVDKSNLMIAYAQAQAKTRSLTNATFRVMDVTQPLDFADNLFDLINARFLFGFMNPTTWPRLSAECVRIARPSGMIRFTEGEAPISNSQATESLYGYFLRSLQTSGRSELVEGRHFATTPLLRKYLVDAGCVNIQNRAYVLDYSSGTLAHDAWTENVEKSFELMSAFYLREKSMTQDQFNDLYRQLQQDHRSKNYYALFFFLSVYGYKPAASKLGQGK